MNLVTKLHCFKHFFTYTDFVFAESSTVYRTCDLIVTCIQRNGAEWRDQILRHLASQVG